MKKLLLSILLVTFSSFGQDSSIIEDHRGEHSAHQIKKEIAENLEAAGVTKKEKVAENMKGHHSKKHSKHHKRGKWYFQFSRGFVDSSYKDLNNNLSNGSDITGFRLSKNVCNCAKFGVGITYGLDFIHSKDDKFFEDSAQMIQFSLRPELFKKHTKTFSTYYGLGLNIGDYDVRRRVSAIGKQITFERIANGIAIGLAPEVGIRFELGKSVALDLGVGYQFYFGSEASNLGGFSVAPRINFAL